MAPSRRAARPVDKRADIWAFGCVLYEMLTGRPAFGGDDVTDSLAAVVEHEPDWSALPADTPAPIRGLLRRCLEKDPSKRLSDIGDAGSSSSVPCSRTRRASGPSAVNLRGGPHAFAGALLQPL